MQPIFRNLTLLIFSLNFNYSLNAQIAGSAEIYYEKIGQNAYVLTANIYRECTSAPLNSINGFVVSGIIAIPMNYKRSNISRIDDKCGNPCNISNSSSNPGYEKHVFKDTVDFNQYPYDTFVKAGKCQVNFAVQQFLRDSNLTTIANQTSNRLMYIDAELNICLSFAQIRSPEFSFDPKFYACCNNPVTYSPGPIDSVDFDSLVFTLEAPLISQGNSVTYTSNYSKDYPVTPYCPPNPGNIHCRGLPNAKPPRGFYFDYETCTIIYTPVKCDERTALRLSITEFRRDSTLKMVKIGKISRELNISVKNCSDNNPPYPAGNYSYNLCENKSSCNSEYLKDDPFLPNQKTLDTVYVDWNRGIPTATATLTDSNAREKTVLFCVNSKILSNNFKYYLGYKAYDKNCNINFISKTLVYKFFPSAKAERNYKIKNCSKLMIDVKIQDTIYNSIRKHVNYFDIFKATDPTKSIYSSNKRKDSFNMPASGTYYIKHVVNIFDFNCPAYYTDTIHIGPVKAQISYLKDSMVCQNNLIGLTPYNSDLDDYDFEWRELGSNKPLDSSRVYSTYMDGIYKSIELLITDRNSCHLKDTVNLIAYGAFKFTPNKNSISVCNGQNLNLSASEFKGIPPFRLQWYSNGIPIGNDSSISFKVFAKTKVSLKVEDESGCSAEDTMHIAVSKIPDFKLPDTALCLLSQNIIEPLKSKFVPDLTYEWRIDNVLQTQKDSFLNLKVLKQHLIALKITNNINCSLEKVGLINYIPLPTFNILSDSIFNKAHFIRMSTDKAFVSYLWSTGATTRNNDFWAYELGAPGTYTIWCEVTDSNGCKSKEQIKIHTDRMTGVSSVLESHFKIYPNPADAVLIIETGRASTFRILSSDGRNILDGELNTGSTQVDVHTLVPGIYIFECDGKFLKFVKS